MTAPFPVSSGVSCLRTSAKPVPSTFHLSGAASFTCGEHRCCWQGVCCPAGEPGLPRHEVTDKREPPWEPSGPVLGSLATGAQQYKCRGPSILHSQELGTWPNFVFCLESLLTVFISVSQQTSLPNLVLFISLLKWDYTGIYPA